MSVQIVVLGPHRSGTSALTGLLQRMGAYVGRPEQLMTPDPVDNASGYFERLDVTQLDEDVLLAAHSKWDRPPVGPIGEALIRTNFDARASAIVAELASHRVSAIKDPRQCLLFEPWRRLIPNPVCLVVFRNPLEVALSQQRRDQTPIEVAVALWELYTRSALAQSSGLRRMIVSHEDMLGEPDGFARNLAGWLNVPTLDARRAPGWIDQRAYRNRAAWDDLPGFLNKSQLALLDALRVGRMDAAELGAPLSPGAAASIAEHRLRWALLASTPAPSPAPRPKTGWRAFIESLVRGGKH